MGADFTLAWQGCPERLLVAHFGPVARHVLLVLGSALLSWPGLELLWLPGLALGLLWLPGLGLLWLRGLWLPWLPEPGLGLVHCLRLGLGLLQLRAGLGGPTGAGGVWLVEPSWLGAEV